MSDKSIISEFDRLVERTVDLPIDKIKNGSVESTRHHIEERCGKTLNLGKTTRGLSYRGNMFLASGRINYDVSSKFNEKFGIGE